MFVDVGVSAGALGGRAEAEPASHPGGFGSGVCCRSAPPVMSVKGRLIQPVAGVRACCCQLEGPLVLGSDGAVEAAPITQTQLGGHVFDMRVILSR